MSTFLSRFRQFMLCTQRKNLAPLDIILLRQSSSVGRWRGLVFSIWWDIPQLSLPYTVIFFPRVLTWLRHDVIELLNSNLKTLLHSDLVKSRIWKGLGSTYFIFSFYCKLCTATSKVLHPVCSLQKCALLSFFPVLTMHSNNTYLIVFWVSWVYRELLKYSRFLFASVR